MPKVTTFQALQADVNDIEGLIINCLKNDVSKDVLKNQARAIILNITKNIEELIKD